MAPAASSFSGYFTSILLLQMAILTSEQFAVRSSTSRQVVTVGAQTEFSCQLSPPQSALHMKVGWFRNQSSQLVYLHENGEEHSRESSRNYVNHTLFLKDALGEGKISLRIYNISIFDGGLYQCFFEDGDTYEEATVDLRVAAIGTDIQINVQVLDTEGLLVVCDSGGWFPQAEMTWRDSQGRTIPHSSKYYSQDGAGLLHLKMSVLLKNSTSGPVTCCFYNPDTGQEKRAGIVIPDILLESKYMFLTLKIVYPAIYVIIVIILFALRYCRTTVQSTYLLIVLKLLPFLLHMAFFPIYFSFRSRVSISDDLHALYCGWMWDLCIMLTLLMLFFTVLILVVLRYLHF
ncbi:putative selection and upkeep of intraepithelial T-cells protein 1 homolog [Sciurus carolinensis]|uniref:putative selection and upkeep of intraepithelial T-cells protein 1 homolog n=1 Tax=Sciurus carolinensis TaxID=30640 RepID=UPI001FB4141D|nr:putative selection and upkeep of intraepithelial T-cells protein 1 homolog [Sciurus carolinensis]